MTDCNSGFVHAITFMKEICIYIQKIISIGREIKKILITIRQTQPSVEGDSQVSLIRIMMIKYNNSNDYHHLIQAE